MTIYETSRLAAQPELHGRIKVAHAHLFVELPALPQYWQPNCPVSSASLAFASEPPYVRMRKSGIGSATRPGPAPCARLLASPGQGAHAPMLSNMFSRSVPSADPRTVGDDEFAQAVNDGRCVVVDVRE